MVYSGYDEDEEHHALEKNRCVGKGMDLTSAYDRRGRYITE